MNLHKTSFGIYYILIRYTPESVLLHWSKGFWIWVAKIFLIPSYENKLRIDESLKSILSPGDSMFSSIKMAIKYDISQIKMAKKKLVSIVGCMVQQKHLILTK